MKESEPLAKEREAHAWKGISLEAQYEEARVREQLAQGDEVEKDDVVADVVEVKEMKEEVKPKRSRRR